MKTLLIAILTGCLALVALTSPPRAELATIDEALAAANNWTTLIIQLKGDWGESETAEVQEICEFRRGARVIGYFCRVKPRGFIVVSLLKELAPVKAYSATSDIDPDSDEGMAHLIKGSMEGILDAIEGRVGAVELAPARELESVLEINHRPAWEELGGNAVLFKEQLKSGEATLNYEGGDPPLLSTRWDQGDPYNRHCPSPEPGHDCKEAHCAVGCTAVAGAQTMRYWCWPPYGEGSPYNDPYDWPNMPDALTGSSSAAQIDAVANLCREVGDACGMDYCVGGKYPCSSSACFASCYGKDLLDAFEDHFRYSDEADDKHRDDESADSWFNLIRGNLGWNRPLPYCMEISGKGHSLVCDGWQVVGTMRQYHMNYGWGGQSDAWYTLDGIPDSDKDTHAMLINIRPAQALGAMLFSSSYPCESFPYRYFDTDTQNFVMLAPQVTFAAGQRLQFLPGVTVQCAGPADGWIRFVGSGSATTHLFSRGDLSRGITIGNGVLRLRENASIRLY